MLLSGPISLICLKLANSIFMPQACYFSLPSFYFTGSPSLIAMEYPRGGGKKGKSKAFCYLLLGKTLEPGKTPQNQCENNKQQWPRKLNPNEKSANEKSASWEPLRN